MNISKLEMRRLDIPFRTTFRHASAVRSATESVLVLAHSTCGQTGYGEGCPRSYVTDETLASAEAFFDEHRSALQSAIRGVRDVREWVITHQSEIDAAPAAWCAIELALLDLLGRVHSQPVEDLLGCPRPSGRFLYSAVIGDDRPEAARSVARRYHEAGFRDFKVKLSGNVERDRAKLDAIRELNRPRIRADANNLWRHPSEAESHLEQIGVSGLVGLEEPFSRDDLDGCRELSRRTGIPIVLDESLRRSNQLRSVSRDPDQWILNLRVSKLGGLFRSLEVLNEARQAGLPIIVGAQVGETSLLTRAGLTVATSAGRSLFAQEGAFGTHLLSADPWSPALQFGSGGFMEAPTPSPGLGCEPSPAGHTGMPLDGSWLGPPTG